MRFVFMALVVFTLLPQAAAAQEVTPSEAAALQAYREGSFSRAVQLYTTALSETDDPSHRARLHVNAAWTLFALGREDEVNTHLRAALLEDPDLNLVPDYYTQEFMDLFEAARRQEFAPARSDSRRRAPNCTGRWKAKRCRARLPTKTRSSGSGTSWENSVPECFR